MVCDTARGIPALNDRIITRLVGRVKLGGGKLAPNKAQKANSRGNAQ